MLPLLDTVSTQPMLQLIANHPRLSPTDDNVSPPPFLPAELIVEVLLRLPVKYLLQFRCVCKLWKTLISDPQFAKKHLLRSTADPSMTHQRLAFSFRTTTKPNKFVSYPLNTLFECPSTRVIQDSFIDLENDKYNILGSCNGLLCLYDIDQCSVILYNPSIRLKSKNSPKLPSLDPAILHKGFGYDQVNDKYKVLLVLENKASKETLTKIYTFGEDSWRTVQNLSFTSNQWLGKYVSGTLNWVGYKEDIGSTQYVILSFDLEKETYREVLLPQNAGHYYVCRPLLNVLSNCLCVCFVNKTHSVLWLMKEYGVVESWTKLTIMAREKFISDSFMDMLFISENGVILMRTLFSQFVLYNINTGVLDYPLARNDSVIHPHIYHESLISPRW